ncbi:MAG: POTRA domain-containing protein, partial [Endozoicomonas sp.]
MFSSLLRADEITWKINGLDKSVEQNALLYLKSLPSFPARNYRDHQSEIRQTLQRAVKALGYYQPTIQIEYSQNKPNLLSIDVETGLPVIVRSVKITLNGDADKDKAFKHLIKHQPLTKHQKDKLFLDRYAPLRTHFEQLTALEQTVTEQDK